MAATRAELAADVRAQAAARFEAMGEEQRSLLSRTVTAGMPGYTAAVRTHGLAVARRPPSRHI